MTTYKNAGNPTTTWLRRAARLWSLPLIVIALLALTGYGWNLATIGVADPHAVPGTPFVEALPPILLFAAILGLALAWRWEAAGGALTLVCSLAAIIVLLVDRPLTQDLSHTAVPYLLSLAVALPGLLFLAGWWRSRPPAAG